MFQRACLLVLFVVTAAAPASSQQWEWQNPTPNGYQINDILMMGEERAIAVCNAGFIMRSWDGGMTWSMSRLGHADLDAIAMGPGGVLFVLTSNGSIYRSFTFGNEWERVHYFASASFRDVHVLASGTVLVSLGVAILRSDDGGDSWRTITPALGPGETVRAVCPRTDREWYAVGSRTAIYRTTDGGTTWQNDPSYVQRGMQRIVFIDSLHAFQLREGQVLMTRDGGAVWKELNIFGFSTNLDVAAGPGFGSSVFVLSNGSYILNASSDDGATWNISLTDAAFPDAFATSMSFANDRRGLIAGEGGRILRTNDGGLSWSIVNGIGNLSIVSQLHFLDERTGLALTRGSSLLRTTNGGLRWNEHALPSARYGELLEVAGPDRTWLLTSDLRSRYEMFHSSDHGRTWELRSQLPIVNDMFRYFSVQDVMEDPAGTLWVGSSYGTLYRSVDGGRTWDSLFVHTSMSGQYDSGMNLHYFPPSTFIYCSGRGVAISTDGTATWSYRQTPLNRTLTDARFFSPERGVGLQNSSFASTTDGGVTWRISSSAANLSLLRFSDEQHGVAVQDIYSSPSEEQTPSVMLRTSDGGGTWTEIPLNERVPWVDWFWISPELGWASAYGGCIRRSTTGGVVTVTSPPRPEPASVTIASTYPAPAVSGRHRNVTLELDVTGDGMVAVELVDVLGRAVSSAPARTVQEGRSLHILHLASSLATGTYLLRVHMQPLTAGRSGTALPSSAMTAVRPLVIVR